MRIVFAFASLLLVAAKRLWNQRWLMFCLLIGLMTAVGFLASIPLYADAVNNRLLQGQLTEAGTYRPPFAFLWRYIGAWHGEITWDDYAPLDLYLSAQAPQIIDLADEFQVRHVSTAKMRLFPDEVQNFAEDAALLWVSAGFISDLERHVTLVEGHYPQVGAADQAVEVLVSRETAAQLGIQVGEAYTLFGSRGDTVQIPLRIAGVWQPLDPADPFWFYEPQAFDETLLTGETNFSDQIVPVLETPVATAVWYQVYDGRRLRPAAVAGLAESIAAVEARATALLANTTLDVSPVAALRDYGTASSELAVILTIFSLPIIGLILYFIILIAGMVVRGEQSEIAIMRSRGMTRGQILFIYLLEGLLIGILGLIGGLLLAQGLVQLMGSTKTFLNFSLLDQEVEPLVTVISPSAVRYSLSAFALVLLALCLPAMAASKHTIITLRWQQARELIRPVWQRYYLDILLLIPPAYGLYQLTRQGRVVNLSGTDDPFSNPMLFLVPLLFCFSLSLFFMRLFPVLAGALARLAGYLPFTTLLMTLRQLARSAGLYTGPLLLLCLTVSLAVFTASMALTLDSHLLDQVYYQVGADLNLAELGENTEASPQQAGLPGQEAITGGSATGSEPQWLFLPVVEHLRVPGVRAAARVGDYSATANIGGRQQAGRLLAIDRFDFAKVAFFRPDFAQNESLGGIMNRLAVDKDNVLVSRDFLARNNLAVGDPLRLTVGAAGQFVDIEFFIAGLLDLFPTQYPQDGPFFVANLDAVHEGLGGTYPYNVWLAVDPTTDGQEIIAGVRELGLVVVTSQDARALIRAEQNQPERQGLFGLLSTGFLAAAALTVLGFLVYAVVSFQRRFIELGMLRAVGLSASQMAAFLAGEQALLILTGVGLGTGLGLAAGKIFIPFLQLGSRKKDLVPPFIVQIAWEQLGTIYVIFGLMFILAVIILTILLLRMKIFEAVKLGEAI